MKGTTVPETTINKDCNTPRSKYKIRMAKKLLVATPSRDAKLPKERNQRYFRVHIAPGANPGHDLRSLCIGKDVGHALLIAFGGFLH